MNPLTPALLTAALLCPAPSRAQAPATPAPTPKADLVPGSGFKNRLFVIKYLAPGPLAQVLHPLTSGNGNTAMEAMDREGLRTITVRDYPENLAAIEEAILRLDRAPAPGRDVEMRIHVFFASKQEGPSEGFPDEIKDVLPALRSTLAYRSFTPAASFVQRAVAGSDHLKGRGQGEMTVKGVALPVEFEWEIRSLRLDQPGPGPGTISLDAFDFSASEHGPGSARMRTDLSLKDGEKVVVGTSSLKDRGLIVVVTARVLK